MIPPHSKLAIYMEGALGADIGKMGYGVLRYSKNAVICVIDSQHSGKFVRDVVSVPRNCPVVSSVQEARELGADVLILGTAPPGGRIPEEWETSIEQAVSLEMSIVNGLHEPLASRFEILSPDQFIWDIRQEPRNLFPASGACRHLENRRVLMIGTDMAVGKMTAGLELLNAAQNQGIRASFVATGQIGITISGAGVPLDAVRVDYASGAMEAEVLRHSESELVIIEGQGSLVHPGSTATLPLMRGSMPTHMILCMRAYQTHLSRLPEIEIPELTSLIHLYESVASVCGTFGSPQVVGVAVNTSGLDDLTSRQVLTDLTALTHLPVSDPVRFGMESILDAIVGS